LRFISPHILKVNCTIMTWYSQLRVKVLWPNGFQQWVSGVRRSGSPRCWHEGLSCKQIFSLSTIHRKGICAHTFLVLESDPLTFRSKTSAHHRYLRAEVIL
jgi:hypothetical protein